MKTEKNFSGAGLFSENQEALVKKVKFLALLLESAAKGGEQP
jgi:hypothetical protein